MCVAAICRSCAVSMQIVEKYDFWVMFYKVTYTLGIKAVKYHKTKKYLCS